MPVTYTFAPTTTILSAEVNANNIYITNIIDKSGGDVYLKPTANGDVVVIEKMPRRNYSANTYQDAFTQSGWGYRVGQDLVATAYNATFAKAFSSDNIRINITAAGQKTTAAGVPTDEADANMTQPFCVGAFGITGNGFTVNLNGLDGANLISSRYYIFHWSAIGPI